MTETPGFRPGPIRRWRSELLASAACLAMLGAGALEASAQDPPDSVVVEADTSRADSLLSRADSLLFRADSLLADSLLADSLRLDSLSVDTIPLLDPGAPARAEAGIWEWNQEQLLWASGFTLADLLRDVPGIWITRVGDYGSAVTTTAFGTGRLRVRIDGVEWIPYQARVVDLAQVPLTGYRTVRVRRGVGGVTIDLYSLRSEDARAYSIIEVGTGDLQTNLFRGTFLLPGALGGTLSGSLERVDTEGDRREEPGALTGIWLRYSLNRGRNSGLEVELRNRSIKQDLFAPREFSRRDVTVRGRVRVAEGVILSSHYTSSSTDGSGGLAIDTVTGDEIEVTGEGIGQLGADLSVRRGNAWGRAGYRRLRGLGVPSSLIDLDVGVSQDRYGGIAAELQRQGWDGRSTRRVGLRGWTTDRLGPYAFFEIDDGSTGIPFVPLLGGGLVRVDSTGTVNIPGALRVQERTSSRFGAGIRWRGLEVEGARVRIEADSVHPLGLATDRGPFAVPGGVRSGVEVRARIPLLVMDNLEFRGSVVRWDDALGSATPDSLNVAPLSVDPWPYLPSFTYDARLHYRSTFLPTENFEMLVVLGIRERDPMTVFTAVDTLPAPPAEGQGPLAPPTNSVPFSQTWYARLELRIVSLRVFVEWENLTLRDANQDFPDRVFPRSRAVYGVRWTLHN